MSLAKTHARQCSQPHRMKFQQKARENIFNVFNFHNIRIFDWEQLKNKALSKGTVKLNGKLYHYNYIFYWGTVIVMLLLLLLCYYVITWFMLGSEEGNKSWFFQLALTHTSWGYVLYLLRHNITLDACHFDKYHKMHPLTLWLSTSTLLNVIWNTTIKVRKIILTILRKALFII